MSKNNLATEMVINGMTFEFGCDIEDVTMNGLFGGEPDTHRVLVPGPWLYLINGHYVSREEFERRLLEARDAERP